MPRQRVKPTVPVTPNYRQSAWSIILVVVGIDQLTKILALTLWSTAVVENTGTVFGLLQNNNTLFIPITLVIIAGVILIGLRNNLELQAGRMRLFATMLLAGGGISNILDRIFHGHIIDFIHLPLWPVFNIADLCVNLGLSILVWYTFFDKE